MNKVCEIGRLADRYNRHVLFWVRAELDRVGVENLFESMGGYSYFYYEADQSQRALEMLKQLAERNPEILCYEKPLIANWT